MARHPADRDEHHAEQDGCDQRSADRRAECAKTQPTPPDRVDQPPDRIVMLHSLSTFVVLGSTCVVLVRRSPFAVQNEDVEPRTSNDLYAVRAANVPSIAIIRIMSASA